MTLKTIKPAKARNKTLKTALLLLLCIATATVSAQTADMSKPVKLRAKTLTRQDVIGDIEAQTGCHVLYNNLDFDSRATVSFPKTELPLKGILDKMAEGSRLAYVVDGKSIVFYRNAELKNRSAVKVSIDRKIAGTVSDAEGKPVEGVTVELMGTNGKAATTFMNGRFQIEGVSSGNHILKLTSADGQNIRFREITVPASKDADVSLVMGGELMAGSSGRTEAGGTDTGATATKTTAWFVPRTTDNTVRALSDEPKMEYSFIPSGRMGEQYMPKAAVKTNLLVMGTTTPNVAVEFAMAKKWTLDVSAAYNPFQLQEGGVNYITVISPEVRYWFCQRFEKHFVGLHLLGGTFNIGDVTFLTETFETNRYDGWGAGAGLTYGYHLPMGRRWAWEFTVGAGYVYLEYDQYRCYECDEHLGKKNKHYLGPTKAGVSLIYMIK